MTSSEITNGIRDKIYSDGDVDYIGLIEGIEITNGFFTTILTLLAALLVVSLQVIIILEVVYINFPLFSEKMDAIMGNGGKRSKICTLTLRDARKAVKDSVIKETNPNLEYLKIKIWAIFITTFILAIAVGGGTWFIGIVSRLLSGPLELLRNALL